MTKKFFGTKTLFKEAQLEAKNVRISCVYETHAIEFFTLIGRCLLDFTTRKLCSFAFKILKVTSINTKSSVKQYFQDISQLKNSIYRAMELSKCRKASLGNGKPVRRLQLALSLTNSS